MRLGDLELLGSRSDDVARRVGRASASRPGAGRHPELAPLLVLCPADDRELRELADIDRGGILRPSAAMTQVPPDRHPEGVPLLLVEGEFTLGLLGHIARAAPAAAPDPERYRMLLWARMGMLLPFFVHNMNNILTQVMGNLELAGLFSADPGKMSGKLETALEGTTRFRDFLSSLGAGASAEGPWSPSCERSVLEMGRMSSGTAVEFECDMEPFSQQETQVGCMEMGAVLGALIGCSTLCVRGCGSVRVESRRRSGSMEVSIGWRAKPSGSRSHVPGMEACRGMLATASALAPPAGIAVRLGPWEEVSGEIALLYGLEAAEREREGR